MKYVGHVKSFYSVYSWYLMLFLVLLLVRRREEGREETFNFSPYLFLQYAGLRRLKNLFCKNDEEIAMFCRICANYSPAIVMIFPTREISILKEDLFVAESNRWLAGVSKSYGGHPQQYLSE